METADVQKAIASEPILLFDGVCNFCNGLVNWIIKRDPKSKFRFAAIQSETGHALLKHFNKSPEDLKTVFLIEDGKIYEKTDVTIKIGSILGGPGKLLLILKIVPGFIRNFFYDLFARNRYRMFGKQEYCIVPTPEIKSRFI